MNTLNSIHLRIYKNLIGIQSSETRVQMINTLLASPEYITSFKQAGLYSLLLQYVSAVQHGERPQLLPGERTGLPLYNATPTDGVNRQMVVHKKSELRHRGGGAAAADEPYKRVIKNGANQKAITYFSSCLAVLNLQEEDALTEEMLKNAYKKAAIKAHPDKGGSEETFDAVTRAYAYLTDILHRVNGGRSQEGKMDAPSNLAVGRNEAAKQWETTVEPTRLNPKNLNMTTFNQMFEATRMPDPDDEGYGDWLRDEKDAAANKKAANFSGEFNRDVFHKLFEEEVRGGADSAAPRFNKSMAIMAIEPQVLAPSMGVELGRDRPNSFTASSDSRLQYTDLRNAYTKDSTFSGQVANVSYESKSYNQFQEERKSTPAPLQDEELRAISETERMILQRESQRKVRAAEHDKQAESYFERIKRLVVTDEKPLSITDR